MSDDLRAPDPTLDALDDSVVIEERRAGGVIAHRLAAHPHEDGKTSYHWELDAIYARYIAVPCRECFPDSPPPGHVVIADDGWARGSRPDPDLAWQTAEGPCSHDSVDTFASGAGRRVDVCMGCHRVLCFWNADREVSP